MTNSLSGPKSVSKSSASASHGWEDVLARFSSASPELLVRRELRRRADTKFLLSPSSAADLLLALRADYAVIGPGAGHIASYSTLYFDTPALDFYHAHRRGRRVRHKVRIRHYPDRRLTLLEIKTRQSELQTTKVSRVREYGDNELSEDDLTFIRACVGTSQGVLPQIWTHFQRLTLLGLHTNERVTFDLNLCLQLGSRRRFLSSIAIVEVKQWPYCGHSTVMSALRSAGRRPSWMSKYCAAISYSHPEVRRNRLLPGLRTLERGIK